VGRASTLREQNVHACTSALTLVPLPVRAAAPPARAPPVLACAPPPPLCPRAPPANPTMQTVSVTATCGACAAVCGAPYTALASPRARQCAVASSPWPWTPPRSRNPATPPARARARPRGWPPGAASAPRRSRLSPRCGPAARSPASAPLLPRAPPVRCPAQSTAIVRARQTKEPSRKRTGRNTPTPTYRHQRTSAQVCAVRRPPAWRVHPAVCESLTCVARASSRMRASSPRSSARCSAACAPSCCSAAFLWCSSRVLDALLPASTSRLCSWPLSRPYWSARFAFSIPCSILACSSVCKRTCSSVTSLRLSSTDRFDEVRPVASWCSCP
jgi:hypothetical protein